MTTPLAQRALEVYDSRGEAAMLAFVTEHLDTRPQGTISNKALLVLKDHTAIQSATHLYNFLWTDQESYREHIITVDRIRNRPAHINIQERPVPTPRNPEA